MPEGSRDEVILGLQARLAELEGLVATNKQALCNTANLLRQTFRETDIIARLGGDEFVVLITEPANVKVILRRCAKAWSATTPKAPEPIRLP